MIFSHYLLPHESNNYKAKSLHTSSLILYIFLLLSVQAIIFFSKKINPNILGYATDIRVEKILDLVNEERQKNNVKPLALSNELSNAATQKATDMFMHNYWAHVSPSGVTPWQFIISSGYNYLYAGENLAKDFSTSGEVIEAWMKSPTHKANILKPEYKEIGISVMNGKLLGDDTTLVVEEFGTRMAGNTEEESENMPQQPNSGVNLSQEKNVKSQEIINNEEKSESIFSYKLTKTISIILAEFLLAILFIDGIYIWRTKTVRVSSHTWAHILFISALLGAMGMAGIGVIL